MPVWRDAGLSIPFDLSLDETFLCSIVLVNEKATYVAEYSGLTINVLNIFYVVLNNSLLE